MTDEEKGSLNAKIMGGLLIAGLAVGGYLWYTHGKKSKGMGEVTENLGDLNTAKTKAGRERQRKAVFARLDSEGKSYPKNKVGKRTKKSKRKK